MKRISRRRFMKETVVMGTGVIALPAFITYETPANQRENQPVDKIVAHPNVDNIRVVGIGDPSMTIDRIFRIYMGGAA